MAGRTKHSKRQIYAEAFALYCDGLTPSQIAEKLDNALDAENIAACALNQHWERKKSALAGSKAIAAHETRVLAQIKVDSVLVSATEDAASKLAQSYVRLIEEASVLPTEPYADTWEQKPTEAERDRQHRHMIRDKADIMRAATEGFRELIEVAQTVGLLKVERGSKAQSDAGDDKPIDLSKLTQLNIAIVNATQAGRQQTQVVARIGEGGEPLDVTAR